ncbi:MAG: CSLREA domain-containing protein, partial [Actinomycetota bacterium]
MSRTSVTQLARRVSLAGALVATVLVADAPPASAANVIVVTTTADVVAADGLTSLREAIDTANS